jgi:uncharacterized integral membrane protein
MINSLNTAKAYILALISAGSTVSSFFAFAIGICQFMAAVVGIVAGMFAIKLTIIKIQNERKKRK